MMRVTNILVMNENVFNTVKQKDFYTSSKMIKLTSVIGDFSAGLYHWSRTNNYDNSKSNIIWLLLARYSPVPCTAPTHFITVTP